MVETIAKLEKRSAFWRLIDYKTMVMTYIHQTFQHTSGAETTIKHLCPWGMRETLSKLLKEPRCLTQNVLPVEVKNEHQELMKSYNKTEWTLIISNTGPKKPEKYHRLYCNHCSKDLLPKLIEVYSDALGDSKNLEGIINNWDALEIPLKYLDYVGCFLPWESDVKAGPNARRFIRDQSEHPKASHIYT